MGYGYVSIEVDVDMGAIWSNMSSQDKKIMLQQYGGGD